MEKEIHAEISTISDVENKNIVAEELGGIAIGSLLNKFRTEINENRVELNKYVLSNIDVDVTTTETEIKTGLLFKKKEAGYNVIAKATALLKKEEDLQNP